MQVDEHAAQIVSVTAVDNEQNTDAIHTAPGLMTTADSLLSVPGETIASQSRAASAVNHAYARAAMLSCVTGTTDVLAFSVAGDLPSEVCSARPCFPE